MLFLPKTFLNLKSTYSYLLTLNKFMCTDAAEQNVQTPRPASVPASESRANKSPAAAADHWAAVDESYSSAGDESRHSTSVSRYVNSASTQSRQQQFGSEATVALAASVSSLSVSVAGPGTGTGTGVSLKSGASGPQPDCIYSLTAMQQQEAAAGNSYSSSFRSVPSASYQVAAQTLAQAQLANANANPYGLQIDSPNLFNCFQLALPLNLATLLEHCPLFRIDCLPFFQPALSNLSSLHRVRSFSHAYSYCSVNNLYIKTIDLSQILYCTVHGEPDACSY